jgi:DNA-binding LacI/PurR family transcriptional regulator
MVERNATPTICLVLGEHLSNYYTGPLVRGGVTAGAAANCRIVLYSTLNTRLWHIRLGLNDLPLLPSGADAYVLPAYVTEDVVEYCAQHGATILIYSGEKADQPSIGPDNRAAGREATAHLIAHGCRRIVHLAGVVDSKEAQGRLLGYRDALAAAGLPYDESLVDYASFGMLEAETITERLLREGIAFDGVFAANDMSAFGAIHALHRTGLRVPEDVAVIGFDDSVLAATFEPPLTTIRQSSFHIGWESVHALVRAKNGHPLPPSISVPTQLIIRASCGCRQDNSTQRDAVEVLAEELCADGALVTPEAAATWVAPLVAALTSEAPLAEIVDSLVTVGERRGWHVLALRSYLDAWWTQQGSMHGDRLWEALNRLIAVVEAHTKRQQLDRADRVNAINYVIDLLREYSLDQSVDAALRYMITSGPLAALSVQRGAGDLISGHRVDMQSLTVPWQGALAAFPPPHWLAPGEALLLMPLEAGAQQRTLVGIVEREGHGHLDLDDLLLRSINTYRSIAVLHQTMRELDAARSVQLSLLPRQAPQSEDYDIAGATRPARQVGGDLYGYYVRPSGALALALGDVAGKGMPAALLMSACATALAGTIPVGLAPSLTLSQIHQMLQPSVGRGQNAAVCLVYLDGSRVRIANAGAVAPLVRGRGGVRMIDIGGLPLGTPLSAAMPYREVEESLAPGDMLILSSDGIVEAMNDQGEMYGFERFEAAIACGPIDGAQALLAHLFADVAAFVGEAEMHDDMAMVVARYCGRVAV